MLCLILTRELRVFIILNPHWPYLLKMYNAKFSPTSPSGFIHFNGMKASFYLDERENNFVSLYIISICLLYSCTCNIILREWGMGRQNRSELTLPKLCPFIFY